MTLLLATLFVACHGLSQSLPLIHTGRMVGSPMRLCMTVDVSQHDRSIVAWQSGLSLRERCAS